MTADIASARPEMVSFDVTSRCNLRCAHCYNDSGSGAGDLSADEVINAAGQILALRPFNVCLCGGEPTCFGGLYEVIDVLRQGVGRVCMVSNGWLVTPESAKALKKHGVDAVQISLDGAFAWQHDTLRGARGSFERAVRAIRLLKEAGIAQVSVATLPTKLNRDTLEEYAKLLVSLGVTLARSMPFIPSGRGATAGRGLMLTDTEYFDFCAKLRELRLRFANELDIVWSDPLSHIRGMIKRADAGKRNIDMEIRSNGDLAVSTYLPIIVGSCKKHTLDEYWKSGYDRIWSDARVRELARRVIGVYDLDAVWPKPYTGQNIRFDIWEERNEISH